MIKEASQNIIDYLKDIFNSKNNMVEKYKRDLIENQQNIGQEKYGECIKDGCQTNLHEISHTIEKLIKASERVCFEDEHHIDLRMEVARKVDKVRALKKKKESLINQLKKKCRAFKKRSIEVKPNVAKKYNKCIEWR